MPDGETTDSDAPYEARYRTRPEARSQNRWTNTGRIANAQTATIAAVEGVENVGPLQVVGEFMENWVDRDNGSEDISLFGGYVYAAYFLTGEHQPWARKSGTLARAKPNSNFRGGGWGAWQIAARYSYADFSDGDLLGGVGRSITVGLNWLWNPNARVQFNFINGDSSDRDVGSSTEGSYDIFGVRLMVDF